MLACLASENWIGLSEGLPNGGRYFEVSLEDGRIVLTPLRLADAEQGREWTAELARMAQEWLKRADQEFDAERDLVAGRCLWEGVRAAVTAVSVKRGTLVETGDEMHALMVALDKESAEPNFTFMAEFGVARVLRRNVEEIDNYDSGQWDGFEFDTARPAVKRLIGRLCEMAAD